MKKQIVAFLLAAVLLSLCACSSGQNSEPFQTSQSSAVSQSASPSFSDPVQPVNGGFSPDFPEELKQYACPWVLNASAQAIKNGTINYYFMASNGMVMDPSSDNPTKWGDSCLIVFPNGKTMLIDGGMPQYGTVLVENLHRLGVKKLDYVVLSHSHADHTGGIALWDSNVTTSDIAIDVIYHSAVSSGWDKVNAACDLRGIPIEILKTGDVLEIGEVRMEVLWPEEEIRQQTVSGTEAGNNSSLVLRFDYKDHSSLFTGDLYETGEKQVIDLCGEKLDADLLKVPHHGYSTSSSPMFVRAVKPEIAVATGYDMRDTIIKRYKTTKCKYLYDKMNSYILVTSDGGEMTYETKQTREDS